MDEEEAGVITIDCFGSYIGTDLPLPCLTFVQLNDEGMTGVCQADIGATLTQIMVGSLGDRPGFVSNTDVDTSTDTVIHYHCLSATRMEGPNAAAEPYILRNHMGGYRSVACQVRLKVDRTVTLASHRPFDRMLAFRTSIIRNTNDEHICRTQVDTKGIDTKKMQRETLSSTGHRVLFYGDWKDEIRDLSNLLGFEVIEEGKR